MNYSLKKQLIISILVPLLLGLIAVSYYIYHYVYHEIEEIFDAELAQTAQLIQNLFDHQKGHIRSIKSKELHHKYEKHISYQVWKGKELIFFSAYAPQVPLADELEFSDQTIGNKQWRVFSLKNGLYTIFTAEDNKARKELARKMLRVLLLNILFVLAGVIWIIYWLIKRSLRILNQLSEEVKKQKIHDLEPLNQNAVPDEIKVLVQAINDLIQRLDDSIQREREFTANASHELRTPLSSIKLHTQLAQKLEQPDLRQRALRKAIQAIDQSNYLIEELLLLSRLPEDDQELEYNTVYIPGLCREIHQAVEQELKQKRITVHLVIPDQDMPLTVESNEALLKVIFRNLLDNAIRYSPDHSQIKCKILVDQTHLSVLIIDQGPGIPEEQLKKVSQRFFRLVGQEIDGCGLGLAIVKKAAQALDAEFKLYNREDGTGLIALIRLSI